MVFHECRRLGIAPPRDEPEVEEGEIGDDEPIERNFETRNEHQFDAFETSNTASERLAPTMNKPHSFKIRGGGGVVQKKKRKQSHKKGGKNRRH